MTMKLRNEFDQVAPKFDPEKQYRYTWPGQPARIVSGAALIQLCKGADPSMLAIEDVEPSRVPTPRVTVTTSILRRAPSRLQRVSDCFRSARSARPAQS